MTGRRSLHHPVLVRLGWFTLLVAAWEALRRIPEVSDLAMPGIPSIVGSLFEALTTGNLPRQIVLSLAVIAGGMGIAVILSLLLTLGTVVSEVIASLVDTLTALFHPLPGIALLPVLILWFGTGLGSVTAIIVHSVLWPLVTNLREGYRTMPVVYRTVSRNLGLSRFGYFYRIVIPASIPFFLGGMRIAWARSWRALISAEMIFGALAGTGGIGWFLYTQRVFMDSSGLFAGIIVVMVLGVAVEDVVFERLDDRVRRRWGTGE